jgi:translocation and assembly module TamB
MPRWTRILLGSLAGLLLLLGIGVVILTQTDFGRERLRRFALTQVAKQVHGNVSVGKVRGNLLTGAMLVDVEITDSTGAPFLKADSLFVAYSLRSLISKRIYLSELRLYRPVIVLDKQPGREWNFSRIFPSDTVPQDTLQQGFGSWVRIEDLSVHDGRLLVRNEWLPDSTLAGAARDSAIAFALSPRSRLRVVRAPGGYQTIQDIRQLNARLPLLRLANPDSANLRADVASMSAVAYLFRPPPAVVRGLTGRFVMSEDSLWFNELRVALPGSRLAVEGAYALETSEVRASLNAEPFQLRDLQWLYPALPDSGGGRLALTVEQRAGRTRVVARTIDVRVEDARFAGHADVQIGDSLRLGDTELRFEDLDTRLVQRLAPEVEVPLDGLASGRLALTGTPERLRVDGLVSFRERGGGLSRVFADGEIGTGRGELRADRLRLRFDPVRVELARTALPDLPIGGTVTGQATLTGSTGRGFALTADLVHSDPRVGRSRVLADGGVRLGEEMAAEELRLRFQPVQLALARAFSPDLPVEGVLAGRLTLDGTPDRMTVDADLTHEGGGVGRSRVLATGGIRLADGFAARDLRLRFLPLQMALVREFSPDLPVAGTISGSATVSGSPATRVSARMDLVHQAPTGTSRVVGEAAVTMAEPRRFDVRLRAPVLSLATVGRFAPSAGLHGTAAGDLAARGTLAELEVAGELAVRGGGAVQARGVFDLASEVKRYDLEASMDSFDAGALTTRAPHTALTGTLAANGRGTDPASAQAVVRADLTGVRVDRGENAPVEVDTIGVLARVGDGLLTVERGRVRLASARAEVAGSFGLVQGRQGTLRYDLVVDSLADFASLLPADTAAYTTAVDSVRVIGVPRDSTSQAAVAVVDSVPVASDSLAGRLQARGVLAGNLENFDLQGTADLDHVYARGNSVGRGTIEYAWLGATAANFSLNVTAALDSIRAGSVALDSARARVDYAGSRDAGSGTARVALFQNPAHDYRLAADYQLALDRKDVLFNDLVLRFDTTSWSSYRPGRVSWGGEGVEVDSVELRSNTGGRLFVDGRIASDGPVDLGLEIDHLQIGDLVGLVQDTVQARGILSLRADLAGSARAPTIRGRADLTELVYGGTELPALTSTFSYDDALMTASAELTRAGTPLLVADARIPVNLALTGVTGSRLLEGPLVADIRADSLPLDALPKFTDAVENVTGRIRGEVAVRGTVRAPEVAGVVDLDLGSLDIVQPGVGLRDIAGTLHIRGDSVSVDSLVAFSDGGPIRVAGAIGIAEPTRPSFDLTLDARDARVLDNDLGRLRADAHVAVEGPFEAVRVTGAIAVNEGTIYIPESEPNLLDLEDPELARMLSRVDSVGGLIPPANPLLANLQVDVGVRIARNTWLRSPDANVEIYTPEDQEALHVRMEHGTRMPTLEGTINADRGDYEFSGRRFQLTSGSLVFLGTTELNPQLQLAAVHEVPQQARAPLTIQINIGGYLSEPTITLSSNSQPPLSQSDLLSYLAFGRSSSALLQPGGSALTGDGGVGGRNLGALATQQLAGVALGAVLDDLVSDLETSAGRAGLDVIRISPANDLPEELVYHGAVGNILRGTEIEAGKYLNPRLFLAVQGRPTNEAAPGIVVEYRTPGGWLWRTTWEPRYLPSQPTFATDQPIDPSRVFGSFLIWERRF